MNTCMHCGFIGNPEEFRYPKGSVCKKCRREQQNKTYQNNKENINKERNKTYQNNKENINKERRKRRQDDQEKFRNREGNYRQRNRERIREQARIRRRKKGIPPWSEIKSLRLGLYIERTIASMFGVPTEPHNTPDIDFICPNGYKMQVKTASVTYGRGNPRWSFGINKNKIADHFILVAVNNIDDIDKEDFKPEHIWMMKGNILNMQSGTSITPSRISK